MAEAVRKHLSAKPSSVSINESSIKAEWNSARNMALVILKKGIQNRVVITQ
jgi:hypothetical protein